MPYDDVLKVQAVVKNQVQGISGAKLEFSYENIAMSQEETALLFIPYMIEEANGKYAHLTKTISPGRSVVSAAGPGEDKTLHIATTGEFVAEQLNSSLSERFSQYIRKKTGFSFKVKFDAGKHEEIEVPEPIPGGEDPELEEILKRRKEAAVKAKEKPAAAAKGTRWAEKNKEAKERAAQFRKRNKYVPVKGNLIMGNPVTGEPAAMNLLTEDMKTVTVKGILFKKEGRELRNGKFLASLCLTDKKGSCCCKAFVLPQKWQDINDNLKEGDMVKIRGAVELDTYENSLVIMTESIEKGTVVTRKDTSSRKRVELHAHTKMSSMDGLNDTKAMVKMHIKWGHTAMAITDHGVVQSFPDAADAAKGEIKIIYGMEGYVFDDYDCIDENGVIDYKRKKTNHIILLAKNQTGLKNLYKLVSFSHLNYFYKRPRLPKSLITKYREGIIIGSACEAGEVYRALVEKKPDEEIKRLVEFYDYLEIQPLVNNRFMIEKGIVNDNEDLKNLNRQIVALGEKYGKPVVATTDAHYTEPEDAIYRNILLAGQGYDDNGGQGLYLRTTDEMLEEFAYLGRETAERVVIDATNLIADMIEVIKPVPDEKYPPKIENAEEQLRTRCMERAWSIYGNPLPPEIQERLDAELIPIIREGYAVMYMAAVLLVQKSLDDGYLVGSRGSVGSSFAATMAGITEVNPLPPHYICPKCKHLEWGDNSEYDCGVDMPVKDCPVCGTRYRQEGFSIPFQTFLGFEADKEPDIDLNFAGEYQATAHKFVDEIFGSKNVFKAGTIGTIAEKTAYGYVMKYYEERQIPINKYEADRLSRNITGVKRTTGQHPGGIVIVPDDHEIYEFCPVQHPANDVNSDIVTTHFDYHKIDKNLLKLDILGHDVPSMIRHLQDMTGLDPINDVPLKDEKVNSIFVNCEALDIKDPDYRFVHGSYGIPEFGTKFTRQMLDDTHPTRFADFVRISGFSHGTDVWINNAQEWIKTGQTTIKDAISTRDDIMNYLILKGLPKKNSFKIMEKVRKGKGVTDEEVALMQEHEVPEWYIESCRRIKYMFPRAHAVAYVMMSYRIAYFKVYYPPEFYAAYFTTKVSEFDAETILRGSAAILKKMDGLILKGKNITQKEENEIIVLEVAYEMYARGYEFLPARLGASDAVKFYAEDALDAAGNRVRKVRIPLVALDGVGENAAKSICEEYKIEPYATIEEITIRGRANKTAIEAMRQHGMLEGMQETDQMSFL
ncbi:MAG: PolC-type DNA polymerase III [Clostridia bacterium]|nr:PolC-type DNA polymerase III [Clostridia bacterium]